MCFTLFMIVDPFCSASFRPQDVLGGIRPYAETAPLAAGVWSWLLSWRAPGTRNGLGWPWNMEGNAGEITGQMKKKDKKRLAASARVFFGEPFGKMLRFRRQVFTWWPRQMPRWNTWAFGFTIPRRWVGGMVASSLKYGRFRWNIYMIYLWRYMYDIYMYICMMYV